jgi:hypothetical protein
LGETALPSEIPGFFWAIPGCLDGAEAPWNLGLDLPGSPARTEKSPLGLLRLWQRG